MKINLTIGIPVWLDRLCAWPLLWYRRRKFGYDFRRVPLGNGLFTIVEPQDYYRVNNFHWTVWFTGRNDQCIYAARTTNDPASKIKVVLLHRDIMNHPPGLLVDHANSDTLDNRRANLRLATRAQNAYNKRKTKSKTSSSFIGVYFEKRKNRWMARIKYQVKRIYLGSFKNEIDAARAYDEAAKKYHKEFARLNFPE
jgi:hypothetical protein